jgi:hypothetical protein
MCFTNTHANAPPMHNNCQGHNSVGIPASKNRQPDSSAGAAGAAGVPTDISLPADICNLKALHIMHFSHNVLECNYMWVAFWKGLQGVMYKIL